ncbi:uncharacterized protein BDZ99DRAFT_512370 [Mytilinidion resinicola]|uniref:Glyoxalase-like domain-containing protein n=1 Tax=Mytilinidion resinicola TaxID=574789 RepID=A0A6A6Y1L7_9PEZI|nr:uncharacterized protein BDZ99DRAFT_512370 [Mytilinidion resinicola]KAF2802706.1 hypothetical protein BDZ99DRAFT_512370 [Mytilinidion resinicola]
MASAGPKSAGGIVPTRLRQVAFVTDDLAKAKRLLTSILGTEIVYEDPRVGAFGLANFLVAIGGDIIEVVAPTTTLRASTTAGRLLKKRGEGGYMIIMQNEDAAARREYITSNKLGKVILNDEHDDVVTVQYHPSGMKGGIIPELDSHRPSKDNPKPLTSPFSPWHACGPDYKAYSAIMKRNTHIQLGGLVCRLAPGDVRHEEAPRQWEDMFGVARSRDLLAFTNARLGFMRGEEGKPEGIVSISIGVTGQDTLQGILDRASKEGLLEDGWVNLLGVKWSFYLASFGNAKTKL